MEDIIKEPHQDPREPLKPVNLPFNPPDLVGEYHSAYDPNIGGGNGANMFDTFDSLVKQATPETPQGFKAVAAKDVDMSGRYPLFFPGRDNEEMYAKNQGSIEKAYNGVAKMSGIAAATFVNGTAGLVYGVTKSIGDGKFSSFYDNELSNSLNDWTTTLEDKYAHYKTERERNGNWWEPSNLFTGNFLWDNIVKNLGFSIGAMGAGFAWGGALGALSRVAGLAGTGVEMAAAAEAAVGEGAVLPEVERLAAINKNLSTLWNSAKTKIGQGMMKSDRGVVATFGTAGEAGLEALSNSQETRRQMVEEFTRTHGYGPTGKEMDDINNTAESIGNSTFWLNTALLTATNYIQLGKIYNSSFKAEKNILNGVARKAGQYAETLPQQGFGKLLYKTGKVASLFFNTAEGFEEGAQFAIQTGTNNYYKKKYGNKEHSILDDGILYGVKEALTTNEGLLNVFTGAFSGALQSSGFVGIKKTEEGKWRPTVGGTGKIGERGVTGYGGEQATIRAEAVKALNETNLANKLKDSYASIKQSEQIQKDREDAIRRGDILESKDLEFDYAHSFITNRIKRNAKEYIDIEVNELKNQAMTEQGFMKLQQEGTAAETDTQETFRARLTNIQEHAESVSKMYDAANLKYKGLINKETKKPVYPDEVIDQMVYAGAKVMDYDRRIPQLNASLAKNGISAAAVLQDILINGTPTVEATEEVLKNIRDLGATNEDEMIVDLHDLIETSLRRKQFIEEYKDIKQNPEKYQQQDAEPLLGPEDEEEVIDEKTPTVTIQTNVGEKKIKVGVEYFVGDVFEYDKNGNIVYKKPRLTVLGENEDGTIKIKEADGTIRDIDKKELAKYKLAPVASTLKNRKAKFFMEHWNTVYEHYGIKVRKDPSDPKSELVPVKGRLKYDTENDKEGVLTFVYLDRQGKRQEVEVSGKMFVHSAKYKHAMLKEVGQLTSAQKAALDEFTKAPDRRANVVLNRRLDIIIELVDELTGKQEKTKKLIETKQEVIKKSQEALAEKRDLIDKAKTDARYKRAIKFKKETSDAIKEAMRLSRLIEQLEKEVEVLEADVIDLQNNLEHIDKFVEDLEDQPLDLDDFLIKLRYERIELVEAIKSTNKSINMLHRVIDAAQKAIDSAVAMLSDLIEKFEAKFPNAPLSLGATWVDFIKQNPNFLKNKPTYKEDLQQVEEMLGFTEDTEIMPNENRIKNAQEHLDIVQDELKDLEKQLLAHDVILDKFKEKIREYRRMQAEEKKMEQIESLRKEFLGTLNKSGIQNFFGKFFYEAEARKDDWDVVGSTKAHSTDTPDKPLPAHHVRANHFGARLETFKNRADIGGVIVTADTEDQLMPGLSDHFLDDIKDPEKKEAARKEVIYLVMVATDEAGKPTPVDMNGVPIPDKTEEESVEDYQRRLRENGIYQVFPQEKLTTTVEEDGKTKVKSMFREDTDPETVASLKKQYADWRKAQLKAPKISRPEKVVASFGIPELNYYVDEHGKKKVDKSKRTSAEAAGLISEGGLNADRLIIVATNNEAVSERKVTFRTPLGRVFLRIPGQGLAKLFNRKLNIKETETIFDAMLQVSKNAFNYGTLQATYTDPETGEDKDNPKAAQNKTILRWLETVVYWGVARDYNTKKQKDAGYNNIWFEEVTEDKKTKLKLFISGINKDSTRAFDFTPTGLKRDRDLIIGLLNGMYNNTNATKVNKETFSNPYEEITGFDSLGNPKITIWPNYQSYLLSEKAPDENGHLTADRDVKEIPLATQYRPLEGKNDTNRKGIYFSLESTAETYDMPIKKAPKAKKEPKEKEPEKKGKEEPKGKKKTGDLTKPENWTLDGKTENTKVLINKFGKIIFTLDIKGIVKSLPKDKAELKAIFDDKKALPKELLNAMNKQFIDLSHKDNLKTVENLAEYYESKGLKEAVAETQAVSTILTSLFRDVTPQILEELAPSKDPVKDKKTKTKKEPKKEPEPKKKEKKEKGKKEEEVEKKEAEITVEEEEAEDDDFDDEWNNTEAPTAADNEAFRARLVEEAKQFEPEQWDKLEAFIAKVLPNFPFYRVQNVIRGTNGREGWGMFHKGAIYVMEAAEIGTGYHEVFEAVWKTFVGPEDKQQIIDEFRNRIGTYVDRESRERIKYSEATDEQLKEQLAEEFRDKVLTGKDPAKYGGEGLIARMFNQLLEFIREFFTGKSAIENTTKLFDAIGNGYYAQFNPYEEGLSYAERGIIDIDEALGDETSEFRPKLPETELHDIIQHMTYTTLTSLTRGNQSFFEVSKIKKEDLYPMLRAEIISRLKGKKEALELSYKEGKLKEKEFARSKGNLKALYNKFKEEWDNIVIQHADHLRLYNVEFDENDEVNLTADENTGKGEFDAANKIDSFRKANSAIKLLFGTLAETEVVNGSNRIKPSSIGGVNLIPADKVSITLTNELHKAVNIEDMFDRLSKFALDNPNYAALYERMTNLTPGNSFDPEKLEDFDIQIMTAFWKTIKKQNADVITVFVLPSGEIIVSDSTLNTSFKQAKRELLDSINEKVRKDRSRYFSYKDGKYYATPMLKKIQFGADLSQHVAFLQELGINFKLKDIRKLGDNLDMFREAVSGLQSDIKTIGDKIEVDGKMVDTAIPGISVKTLNSDRNLTKLSLIKAIIERTDFESTYFNVNGERTQTFIGTNVVSALFDVLSKLGNIDELADEEKYGHYAYLRTDVFAKGSVFLKKMFDLEGVNPSGRRREGTENLGKPVFIDGLVDQETGKKKASSKLTLKQRLTQEINLNLSGIFLNLVPGDASIEHAIRMYNRKSPFVSEETFKNGSYLDLFKDLLASEIELSRDDRPVKQEADAKGKNTDLRFFQAILGSNPELVKKLTDKKNKKTSPEKLIEDNKSAIEDAIEEFIAKEAVDTEGLLSDFGILYMDDNGYKTDGILLGETKTLTRAELNVALRTLAANYVISNMEMHKLIYSDPYQYSDELKRIKNFNSPGQPLVFGSEKIRKAFDKKYNAGYTKGQPGWTDMIRDHFRTVTFDDIWTTNKNLGYDSPFEETDGGGYITLMAYRKFKLASGDWTSANEKQYRHDIGYEKLVKNGATKAQLALYDKDNPNEKSTYTPLKPIVRGSKANGRNYNDIMLDKFALVPLSFRILHELNPNSNALKLYNKMQKEDIDYGVFASGRKVGAEKTSPLLTSKGEFDNTPFATPEELKKNVKPSVMRAVTNVPFAIVAVQSEIPSKDTPKVTQGSQITKLATMDYLEAGMPIDFLPEQEFDDRFVKWMELDTEEAKRNASELYREIKDNEKLLVARLEEGVEALYKKLGLEKVEITNDEGETERSFVIKDPKKLAKTLKDEIAKREINSNIIKALEGFEKGHVVLEATPAYQQIRNVLFSIADKTIVRPKISGGQKVQIPSTLLSDYRITTDKVSKKGKPVYESEALDFYSRTEDGKKVNVCQIMVGRWFKSPMTDEQLMYYFNKTKEGQAQLAALSGVAFRIPTQKQNSIDVFEIKQFLPQAFGDSVVIPSALVLKAGSDFDIDKLSVYLKNMFTDANGNLKVVPYFGTGAEAKAKFAEMFDRGELLKPEQHRELNKLIKNAANGDPETKLLLDLLTAGTNDEKRAEIEKELFGDNGIFSSDVIIEDFLEQMQEEDADIRDITIDLMYKQSLENEYIGSLERLISNPLNYDNLVKPNDASQMRDLSDDIQKKLGKEKIDYSSTKNMLSRRFMSDLRHAFVTGKYAIGIAAVSQVGHAQRQRSTVIVDMDRLTNPNMDPSDVQILGGDKKSTMYATDSAINFQEYNSIMVDGVRKPILSKAKNAAGHYISDIIGQFIDGYVDIAKGPWIMKLGATPNVAGTWLYLLEAGVPADTLSYFMNQPIIKDYLQAIDNAGYSWLFIDSILESVLDAYANEGKEVNVSGIPNTTSLYKTIGKHRDDMGAKERSEQQYMLKEFLKYAKTASHLFEVTQGSNFDTATINDPYLVFKKMMQLAKARNTVISSVDDILDSSFVGPLKNIIMDYRNAFAEVLISDRKNIRSVMEKVLLPYINKSDRDFVRISQKAVNDLFDWAVQNKTGVNSRVTSILLGKGDQDSAATQIMDYVYDIIGDGSAEDTGKKKHPLYNNIIINSIKREGGRRKIGKVQNLYLSGRDNKVYDQNLIIHGFAELRDHLKTENNLELYGKLTRLALLQSGLSNSPIAFTTLLPYEDFKDLYNETLYTLENMEGLEEFYNLDVFQRNNANNSDVASYKSSKMYYGISGYTGVPYKLNLDVDTLLHTVKAAVDDGTIPKVVGISSSSSEGKSDFIVYQWEDDISREERARRRKIEDRSHVHKVLAKKVYREVNGKRVPVVQRTLSKSGIVYEKYIYKAINVWGDSFRAQEHYDYARQSVLDNDFDKVPDPDVPNDLTRTGEVEDAKIAKYFRSDGQIEENPKAGRTVKKVKEAPVDKRVEKALKKEKKNSSKGKPEIKRSNKKGC